MSHRPKRSRPSGTTGTATNTPGDAEAKYTCPDCTVTDLVHSPECPTVGAALDDTLARDRTWCAVHIGEWRRPATAGERAHLRHMGISAMHVIVQPLAPGVRRRRIGSLDLIDCDHGSQHALAQLEARLGALPPTWRYVSPRATTYYYRAEAAA